MKNNLLVIFMGVVLVMASVIGEEANQIGTGTRYGDSISVLNIMYRGSVIKGNGASKKAIGIYSQQRSGYSALELMYEKEFRNFEH